MLYELSGAKIATSRKGFFALKMMGEVDDSFNRKIRNLLLIALFNPVLKALGYVR